MPTYRYSCKDCSSRFDVQATIREMEDQKGDKFTCPSCHSRSVKKIFSIPNFLKNITSREKKCCCSGGSCCSGEKKNCDDPHSCCS